MSSFGLIDVNDFSIGVHIEGTEPANQAHFNGNTCLHICVSDCTTGIYLQAQNSSEITGNNFNIQLQATANMQHGVQTAGRVKNNKFTIMPWDWNLASGDIVYAGDAFFQDNIVDILDQGYDKIQYGGLFNKYNLADVGSVECIGHYIEYDDANKAIGTIPADCYVKDIHIDIVTEFNAGNNDDELTIGYTADEDAFMTALDINGATDVQDTSANHGAEFGFEGTERAVVVYYNQSGTAATQGKAYVLIEFIRARNIY